MKSENKFKKWEEVRSKGFLKFVIKGIAYFGGGCVIAFTLLELIYRFLDSELKRNDFFEVNTFIFFLFFCLLGGIGWSAFVWIWTEISYKSHVKKFK